MLKIKKILLSGFRGIIDIQELSILNGRNPTSLVIYGLNSSGKTSFVDALEWFLSPINEIEWLKREDAGPHAYPHQEAPDGKTYVEVEFSDKNIDLLRKTFNNRKITIPTLSSEEKFNNLYKLFTIRPYLRYLEIIDFVINRTGVEKYQKLANWMGFEDELRFQEKLALTIIPSLKRAKEKIVSQKEWIVEEIKRFIGKASINKNDLIEYCNSILQKNGKLKITELSDINSIINSLEKKRSNKNNSVLPLITRALTMLSLIMLDKNIISIFQTLNTKIKNFNLKKELADKIEYLNLYEKATEILNKQGKESVSCPVCGLDWKKTKLISHIKKELELLQEIKKNHDNLIDQVQKFKDIISNEIDSIDKILLQVNPLKDIGLIIESKDLEAYRDILSTISVTLTGSIFEIDFKIDNNLQNVLKKAFLNFVLIKNKLKKHIVKIQPSKEELELNQLIEKLKTLVEKLKQYKSISNKLIFYETEINKFIVIGDVFFELVKNEITQRFKKISSLIEKYFKILRPDKDVKGIEIVLNLDKARAAGRSAEIQLSYYDIVVKPAYKVLSESLLNSLGLAVYFTCVKMFNTQGKFIILDDIMNSLDVGHRDTLLDLIEKEFSDYQIILFTHDLHWFERIQRRFPNWLHKKIKSWTYTTGPKIDKVKTSLEEIKDLLQDATKAHDAGRNLGIYIEDILNELCEKLYVEIRYRYIKNDPPSLEELFNSLSKRIKDKLNKNKVLELIKNAQKYEPLLRNATSHSRSNYSSSISPGEVKRAMDEWIKVEKVLWCSKCNKFVEYKQERDQIECRCGNLKLTRTN
ncbi:MAG: hypothetical protein AAB441_00970 [Patescibacteria group bacterium]